MLERRITSGTFDELDCVPLNVSSLTHPRNILFVSLLVIALKNARDLYIY